MSILPSLKSEAIYARDLVKAGLDAATSAAKPGPDGQPPASIARASQLALVPTAMGVAVGVLGIYLGRKDRNVVSAVLGGLVGGAIGFTGGVAWGTRDQTRLACQNAAQNVQAVRDAHWLEKHPVAYA